SRGDGKAPPGTAQLLDLVLAVEAGAAGHVVVLDEAHALEHRVFRGITVEVARGAGGKDRVLVGAGGVVLVRVVERIVDGEVERGPGRHLPGRRVGRRVALLAGRLAAHAWTLGRPADRHRELARQNRAGLGRVLALEVAHRRVVQLAHVHQRLGGL